MKSSPKTIDEYISGFPRDVQDNLEQVRAAVQKAAPQAKETISYKMPTINLDGRYLVYFSACKSHIGFYPAPIGNPEFAEDVAKYGAGKGPLKFPYDKPIPLDLISRVVAHRVNENLAAAKGKKKSDHGKA
jgi:uncharacterized protein YdhG (YjbR/CyaY superfamily)